MINLRELVCRARDDRRVEAEKQASQRTDKRALDYMPVNSQSAPNPLPNERILIKRTQIVY